MSSRNGDKSRYRINQKRKLAKRARLRALMATLQPGTPAPEKAAARRR
jgi:hypothetical protein